MSGKTEQVLVGGRVRRQPWKQSRGIAPKVKAWSEADVNRPRFTDDWDVEYYDTLQWTDVKTNHNKYYCLELHIGKDKGKSVFRLYTHYGRTDDLVKNPKAGRRENRFYSTLEQAEDAYASLIEEKTITKGYRKVELVFSNIGSDKLRRLITEIASEKASLANKNASSSSSSLRAGADSFVDTAPLTPEVTNLVEYIYEEASAALNNTLGPAKITSLGIETPLGVVNVSQIEKGEAILQRLYEMFKLGTHDEEAVEELTNQFYTVIPHNLGRQRHQISSTKINSMAAFEEKQDLLQLMRDMLAVTADGKSQQLGSSSQVTDVEMKYRALRTKIDLVERDSNLATYNEVLDLVMNRPLGTTQNMSTSNANASSNNNSSSGGDNSDLIKIHRVYQITRPIERAAFGQNRVQTNQRFLFHGSRISNYVGLLSRGLMMPKMVVAMGGKRRDGGLLGNGIYFGDNAATSAQYCTSGAKGTRLMLINNVALGTVKEYEQVVFGLMEPPQGFHSVHGVKNSPPQRITDFKDDEYVIFNPAQQFQQYLVEFTLTKDLDEFVTSQVFHNADGTSSVQLKSGAAKSVLGTTTLSGAKASENLIPEKDEIASTVDDIFANLNVGPSAASSSSSYSSKFGGSLKGRGAGGTTFSTPFSSMLTGGSGVASEALKLQPSTLQTTGLLKPSGLSSVPSNSGNTFSSSTAFGGSLKLQPSGLTTNVKLAPLSTSFGLKSTATEGVTASLNAFKIDQPFDASLQTATASGAAAILQSKSTGPDTSSALPNAELTEEEKAAKRAAMKMGGKNFSFAKPIAEAAPSSSSYSSFGASSSAYSASSSASSFGYKNENSSASAYSASLGSVDPYSFSAYNSGDIGSAPTLPIAAPVATRAEKTEIPVRQPLTPELALPSTSTVTHTPKKRKHIADEDVAVNSKDAGDKKSSSSRFVPDDVSVDLSADSFIPHKRAKNRLDGSSNGSDATRAQKAKKTEKSNFSSSKPTLSSTTTAYSSSAMSAALSKFPTLSSTTSQLSASVSNFKTFSSNFGLGASATSLAPSSIGLAGSFTSNASMTTRAGLGTSSQNGFSFGTASVSGLSASTTAANTVRTAYNIDTPHSKLSLLLPKEILKEKISESKLRALYSSDRNNILLKDHVHLIDVFKKREIMRNTLESEAEKTIPKIMTRHRMPGPIIDASMVNKHPFGAQYDPSTQGEYCIVDFEIFKKNFAALTGDIFSSMNDLRNCLFLGDLVVGAMMRTSDGKHAGNDENIFKMFRDADIEVALVGLDVESFKRKVNEILFAVQSITKATSELVRTNEEILILSQYPVRTIRIPLKQFKGPAEAIFARGDVDCVAVGYEGGLTNDSKTISALASANAGAVWALPRFVRAMTKRYNLVDLELRHVTYEVNLYKWAQKGFAVAIPGFQRQLVTPHLFQQMPWQVTGLAKLLLFEELELNAKYKEFTKKGKIVPVAPWMPKHQRYAVYTRDEFSEHKIHEFQARQKNVYAREKENIDEIEFDHHAVLYVPWGPQWCITRVVKHLRFANTQYSKAVGDDKRQILHFGAENVFKGLTITENASEGTKKSSANVESFEGVDCKLIEASAVTQGAIEIVALKSATYDALYAASRFANRSNDVIAPLETQKKLSGSMNGSSSSGKGGLAVSNEISSISGSNGTRMPDWYHEAYTLEGTAVEMIHALTDAAWRSDAEATKKLIRKLPRGSDLSHVSSYAQGRNALSYACINGDADMISLLLGKSIGNINQVDATSGLSPIHMAAYSGSSEAVETLLRTPGVDINVKSRGEEGWTPLHFASYYGHLQVLEVLLQDTKIKSELRDKAGRTAAFISAYCGHTPCLVMFKAHGAKLDTKAPNEEIGTSSVQIAAQRGHAEARQYLIDVIRPDLAPALIPAEDSLEPFSFDANKSNDNTDKKPLDGTSESLAESPRNFANPADILAWSMVDKYGQNMLHYAVRYGQCALVQQIVRDAIARRDPNFLAKVDDIEMPAELSALNLIDLNHENIYGHTAFYYVQQLLDAFHGPTVNLEKLKNEDAAVGTIEALGVPPVKYATALRTIKKLLTAAGVQRSTLCFHRELPKIDVSTGAPLSSGAAASNQSKLATNVPSDNNSDIPCYEDVAMKNAMFKFANAAKQALKKVESERKMREAEIQAEEDKMLAKRMASTSRTPLKRKISGDATQKASPHSPQSALRRSGSRRTMPNNSSLAYGPRGPGFNFSSSSSPSPIPTTLEEFANTNDTSQLLATISQMHKAKVLSDSHRTTLKVLALKKDRRVYSALKAFQHDHVSLAFGNTLQLIARTHLFVNKS